MMIDTLIENAGYAHSRQVSKISALLAASAGYSTEEISIIEQAALYHDVGKSAIPPEILSKPGALTAEEYAIVKTHTDAGARQLQDLARMLTIASQIAREHHERCDGSGYMNMQGYELHPYSKLISVVDVFEALFSARSYKSAWDMNKIQEFFSNQANQFNPDMVKLLFSNIEKIVSLY